MFGMPEAILAMVTQGSVKSVQRGVSAGAGNVVINSVNTDKTMVLSRSKGSAGYVAARGTSSQLLRAWDPDNQMYWYVSARSQAGTLNIYDTTYEAFNVEVNLTGGDTDLTVKEFSAKLVNATTISCDGACEWEVVEFV